MKKVAAVFCAVLFVQVIVVVQALQQQSDLNGQLSMLKQVLEQFAKKQEARGYPTPPKGTELKERALARETATSQDVSVPFGITSTIYSRKLTMTLINEGTDTLSLYWVNYSGKAELYGTINPGYYIIQRSYGTNPWILTGSSGQIVQILIPYQNNIVFTINDEASW